ncbi:MAG: FUSC family protein [Cyanobacteria bacterium]|nr:FUSC family protein [Cyanobacteriota bacterium]
MLPPSVLRNTLKYGVAAALAGALAMNRKDVDFVWYTLVAVVMCMDETDTRVLAASRTRVLGTVTGGVVAGLVHTILSGWIGLTVSLLLVVPLLRLLGWQSSRGLGMLVCSMLFLIEHYSQLDWVYVLNRILDTLLGIAAVLVVSYLFWPVNRLAEIRGLDGQLRASTQERLVAIRQWLKTGHAEPVAAPVAIIGSRLAQQLSRLVNDGPGQRQRWRQRGLLWERINHHSLQLQRLVRMLPQGALAGADTPWLEGLPEMLAPSPQPVVPPLAKRQSLVRLASDHGLAPLLLLAVDDELQRLVRSLHSLALASRHDDQPGPGAHRSGGPS